VPLLIVFFSNFSISEQVIADQIQRGVQVESHRFIKSPHVNHFRLHPNEYGQLLEHFFIS